MRILFVTSNRIGDAVLSTGLLDHLIRTYPDSSITVACGPVAEEVFARMPNRERTIVLEKRRYGMHWVPLWWAAIRTHWDLVVDIRSFALAYLVFTRRRAVLRKTTGHKTVQLASVLGLDPPPLPVVWTAPEDRARAASLLPPPGVPLIMLGPTANWTGKLWPPERFAALFEQLGAGLFPGARAVVLAGRGDFERTLAEPLLKALPHAIDLSGRLSLPEAAAVLSRAAIYVGNDSGLMHLAAAAGAPTLGLFGPTPSAEYGPAGRSTASAVSPTWRMEDLTVESVYEAARRLVPVSQAA